MLINKIENSNMQVRIYLDSIKKDLKQKKYDFIMTGRTSKKAIVLKENLNLNENDFIEFSNDIINNKLKGEDSRYDFYLRSKEDSNRYRIKSNKSKKNNKCIGPLIDTNNSKGVILYNTIDNELSFQLTKNIDEAMKKCNKLSCKIKDKSTDKTVIIIKRNFNITDMKFIGDELELKFSDSLEFDNYKDIKIYLLDRASKEKYFFKIKKENVLSEKIIRLQLNDFINNHTQDKKRWDLYLEYKEGQVLAEGRIGMYESFFEEKSNRYIVAKECYSNMLVPYVTNNNGISFMINTYARYVVEKYDPHINVKDVKVKNGKISVKGEFNLVEDLNYNINSALLTLRNKTKDNIDYKIDVKSKKIKDGYKYEFDIDVEKYKFEQFYWDLYLIINVNDELIKIRVKNPINRVRFKIDNKVIKYTTNLKDNYIFYPYITVNNCLSFTLRQRGEYEVLKYKIKEKFAEYIYKTLKIYLDSRESWLIYEKYSETAQDNSFYFFKHCYENHPNKSIYYVIAKNSPDYDNIKQYKDKVVHFMSIKHLILICSAKLLVASESRAHAYAWKVQRGYIKNKLAQKKMVFLQHGVIALKKIDNGFRKKSPNGCDLFVVSSNYEKEIIKEHFNYDYNEILVNGLARWDVLKDKSKDIKNKEIFFMPTWRNWLEEVPQKEFEQSAYFKNYIELLNSSRLENILKKNNITINYFVHPKFKYYIDKFSSSCENIKIIQPGDIQVNDLLMRASLLVTDYSSVAWEMYYQNKPTLFYHFDIEDYNTHQGSYLDMEKELFGHSAFDCNELINHIEKYINTGFKQPEKFEKMRSQYFAHIDDKNCERTLKSIMKNKKRLYKKLSKRQVIIKELRKNPTVKKQWRKLKNNDIFGNNIVAFKSKIFKAFKIDKKTKAKACS